MTEKIKYDPSLNDIIKLNIGFKTLQLLGQVVRDSPTSLKADIKLQTTKAVYLLGLRILRAVLAIAKENLDETRKLLAAILLEHRKFDTPIDLAKATDAALTNITRYCCYGIIKKISYAVGLKDLEQTYRAVLKDLSGLTSVRLIDLSIQLDHFEAYPEETILSLVANL